MRVLVLIIIGVFIVNTLLSGKPQPRQRQSRRGKQDMLKRFVMNNAVEDMTPEETQQMFTTLQNTIANTKVQKPTPDQLEIFQKDHEDWYTVKPRKSVDLQMSNNKTAEFMKTDLVTQVNEHEIDLKK